VSVAVQADRKLLVPGSSAGDFDVVRFNADGSLDTAFGRGGRVSLDFGSNADRATRAFALAGGKVLAIGATGDAFNDRGGGPNSAGVGIVLTRFNADGSLDAGFGGGDGVAVHSRLAPDPSRQFDHAAAAVLLPDGKIVVAGTRFTFQSPTSPSTLGSDFFLARFNADGGVDTSFGAGGSVVTDIAGGSDGAFDVALLPDGDLVAVGYADPSPDPSTFEQRDFAVARYNPDGSPDA
jgi:uncharacterized delta-60 repeat protein